MQSKALVSFGHRPVHVLNRHKDCNNEVETTHVMMHVFPRQFKLHNVFTSKVDSKESAQAFKDYTLREQEIKRMIHERCTGKPAGAVPEAETVPVPKRLRGAPQALVTAIRKRHARCPYNALVRHYCLPTGQGGQVDNESRQVAQDSVFDMTTPVAGVSAFCRSVVNHVFPSVAWGQGEDGELNKKVVMRSIDHFVRLRRYEGMTLHDVMQNIKVHICCKCSVHLLMLTDLQISTIKWLDPPKKHTGTKLSLTDLTKRTEIIAELIYYLFDSFLIPLLSSNFHITESSSHRNQLFYFRHDVWQKLAQPTLSSLGVSVFEELSPAATKRMLSTRALGTSQVRLLPKESGLRPIINLRRRVLSKVNGRVVLGKSINSFVKPAFNVLNYEKVWPRSVDD